MQPLDFSTFPRVALLISRAMRLLRCSHNADWQVLVHISEAGRSSLLLKAVMAKSVELHTRVVGQVRLIEVFRQ